MRKVAVALVLVGIAALVLAPEAVAHNCTGGVEDCLRTGGFLAWVAVSGSAVAGLSALTFGTRGQGEDAGEEDTFVLPSGPGDGTGSSPADAPGTDVTGALDSAIFGPRPAGPPDHPPPGDAPPDDSGLPPPRDPRAFDPDDPGLPPPPPRGP
jgi:hypothetical protein